MDAITYSTYGGPEVLEFESVERPSPDADEVCIDVHAASVNAADWHLVRGTPVFIRLMYGGLLKPDIGILGNDVAGVVEAVGSSVSEFEPGDAVFGDVSESGFGGFAEYVCAGEDAVVSKPAGVSFEAAAAAPTAGVTALQALRDAGDIDAGERVAINGASGGVGTFAVQLAKDFETEVTGVCSTEKMDVVRSIGADRVVDYTRENVTADGRTYDLILDAAASHSLRAYRQSLDPDGRYVMVGGPAGRFVATAAFGPVLSALDGRSFGTFEMAPDAADLDTLSALLESGAVEPVVDSEFSLAEVPEAIRYLEAGRATGKIVISV